MHYPSWETQPPFFYAPKFASLSALRWLAIAVISIPAIACFSNAVSLPIAALALNVCESILLLGGQHFAATAYGVATRKRPNLSLEPTQHFVVSSRSMRRQIAKVLGAYLFVGSNVYPWATSIRLNSEPPMPKTGETVLAGC